MEAVFLSMMGNAPDAFVRSLGIPLEPASRLLRDMTAWFSAPLSEVAVMVDRLAPSDADVVRAIFAGLDYTVRHGRHAHTIRALSRITWIKGRLNLIARDLERTSDLERENATLREQALCGICSTNAKAYALPCGHTMCGSCLAALRTLHCPWDRLPFAHSQCLRLYL